MQVSIAQNTCIGIPGAMYDCALALASFVVDEIIVNKREGDPAAARAMRILELGTGSGACALLVAAACSSRGVPARLLLTDRNPKSVDLARCNADVLQLSSGNVEIDVARFAFGEDVGTYLPTDFATPDVVVVSDVLYSPESAVPLARTLRQLLRHDDDGESVLASPADRRQPACYLAWRPRSCNPDKVTAVKAFIVECGALGLSVHDASRSNGRAASTARVWDEAAGGEGWSQTYDPANAAREGLRILKIEST